MTPYYEDDSVRLYHGDCRDVLPTLDRVALVLTDPPYGIADKWQGGFSDKHGWGRAGNDAFERNGWDKSADTDTVKAAIAAGRDAVVWGGNYFDLPVSRGWFVWTKPERNFSLSEAELAWTTRDNVIRVWDGVRSDYGREHPTQKPEKLMVWCLSYFPDATTVLDPFAGSGTTLVAAKRLGRRAIGIEINEAYCEIAARRLSQGALPLEFVS